MDQNETRVFPVLEPKWQECYRRLRSHLESIARKLGLKVHSVIQQVGNDRGRLDYVLGRKYLFPCRTIARVYLIQEIEKEKEIIWIKIALRKHWYKTFQRETRDWQDFNLLVEKLETIFPRVELKITDYHSDANFIIITS